MAFANTEGGVIFIEKVTGRKELLDSARLDDKVNKYVTPRISDIRSQKKGQGWEIRVGKSPNAPHIFVQEGHYTDSRGRQKSAFYPGQIYVRHSSKTEPATDEDIRRIIEQRARESVQEILTRLGNMIGTLAERLSKFDINLSDVKMLLSLTNRGGIPATPTEEGGIPSIVLETDKIYPYTAKSLADKIGKSPNWVAHAAQKLGIKDNRKYSFKTTGTDNKTVIQWRYNEAALRLLEEKAKDPDFNPYR